MKIFQYLKYSSLLTPVSVKPHRAPLLSLRLSSDALINFRLALNESPSSRSRFSKLDSFKFKLWKQGLLMRESLFLGGYFRLGDSLAAQCCKHLSHKSRNEDHFISIFYAFSFRLKIFFQPKKVIFCVSFLWNFFLVILFLVQKQLNKDT